MKLLLLLPLFFSQIAKTEGLSPSDMQNIQMLRAQKEMQEREQDFKNPIKVNGTEGRASEGAEDAAITIIAFSDFECPYCKNGAETVAQVRKKYGSKVRVQFRHMPLPFHKLAMPAAKRFEAIALQSPKKAYKFHDEVFKEQSRLSGEGEAFLDAVAKKVGANIEKMKAELDGEKVMARINGDISEAQRLGISGTPAFVVAGTRLYGAYPAAEFYKVIDRRLKEKKS